MCYKKLKYAYIRYIKNYVVITNMLSQHLLRLP